MAAMREVGGDESCPMFTVVQPCGGAAAGIHLGEGLPARARLGNALDDNPGFWTTILLGYGSGTDKAPIQDQWCAR